MQRVRFAPKADIHCGKRNVRYVRKGDIAATKKSSENFCRLRQITLWHAMPERAAATISIAAVSARQRVVRLSFSIADELR